MFEIGGILVKLEELKFLGHPVHICWFWMDIELPGRRGWHDGKLARRPGTLTTDWREPGRSPTDVQQNNLRAIAVLTLSVQLFAAVVGQRTILLPPLGQFLRFPFQILLVNRILQIELLRRRSQILGVLLVAQSQLASGWRFSAWSIRYNFVLLLIIMHLEKDR